MPAIAVGSPSIEVPKFALDERRFGVEIEYVGPYPDQAVEELQRLGVDVEEEEYNHETRDHWKIVEEGGADGELVSPPLAGRDGAREVAVACAALKNRYARIIHANGLHVHHDIKNLEVADVVRLARSYHWSQQAIDPIMSPDRYYWALGEGRIQLLQDVKSETELHRWIRQTGRRVLGFISLLNYGTVEFRQHEGTVEAEEILAWTAFGQSLIAACANGVEIARGTTKRLLAALQAYGNLDPAAAEFLERKARRLTGSV